MRIIGFSIWFLALVACNDTMKDVYENENLPLQIAGKVTDIVAYKGGGVSIVVKTTAIREQEIAISGGVKHVIRKCDFFRKLKNSNQCEIVDTTASTVVTAIQFPKISNRRLSRSRNGRRA